jgi:AcrR family transcriptional regulator
VNAARSGARAKPSARGNGYLDRAAVVRAAAELADRDGWSAVTLSQVAKEVDRHVTSMYAHVDSLADLKRQVGLYAVDELSDAAWRAAMGRVKGDALQAIADVYLDYATKHPGRVASIGELRFDDDEAADHGRRLAEPLRATFRSFGLDDERAAAAHRVFSATIAGFIGSGTEEDLRHAVALFVVGLTSGEWPAA